MKFLRWRYLNLQWSASSRSEISRGSICCASNADRAGQQTGLQSRQNLFTGTVASNLRYGRPEATDDELWEALELAQAADFVAAMPEGLEAPIAQGGTNVSGGQRQRLAIARALVRRPRVYLFDLQSGRQTQLGDFPGMTFAPRFAPDGNSLLMAVANGNGSDIVSVDLGSHTPRRLTESGSIDVSP